MADIHKAAGIIIRGKKLLVERSKDKDFFISPGGSIEEGETARQALVRELKEEFDIDTKEEDFEHFDTTKAPAANSPERMVVMETFMVHNFSGEPIPSSEVEELRWVTTADIGSLPLGSIFEHTIMPRLKQLDLID